MVVSSHAVNDPLSFGGAPSSLTPGRTGLSGKAFRVPKRHANTPGAAKSHGAAAPQTKFHGILKELQFSAAPTGTEEKPAAPVVGPTTTTKRLQFESHLKQQSHQTPVDATLFATEAAAATTAPTAAAAAAATTTGGLPGGFKSSMRKVTFGGNTVSPSHNPPRRSSVMVGFQTPSAIAEGGSGDEEEEEAASRGNGTVNSHNAGATPFDRRLSALLSKYEGENEADAGLTATGTSPVNDLWKRLSSISATESIKALSASGRMSTDGEKKRKDTDRNNNTGNNSSLESMSLAGSTPVVLVKASDAAPVAAAAEGKNMEDTDISPNTAVASVLGVLLRRSLEDIEASKAAEAEAVPRSLPSSQDAVSPTSGVLSMVPAAHSDSTAAVTPPIASARSLTPMSVDGVLRDDEGIPIATPSSVTSFRGATQAPQRNSDGIPADLLRGFTTPPEVEDVMVNRESAPALNAPAVTDFAFNLPESVRQHHQATANTPASAIATPATTPGGASDTASEGTGTPDLKLKSGLGTGAKTGRHGPFPLRFTPTPSSARNVNRASSQAAASFGKAQRVRTPSPSPAAGVTTNGETTPEQGVCDLCPPPSLTKELRGLMNGMFLATPAPASTVASLSPARASPMQQRELGVKTVVTPVRRSPRVAASASATNADGGSKDGGVTDMLEAAGFVYVPNPALSTEKDGGDFKREKKEVNSSVKAKGKSTNVTPRSGAKAAGAGKEERAVAVATVVTDENSEITLVSRYGLRSASKGTNTKSKTASNKHGSGDKALKLSPTEQNIRNSLRRSSRRQSSTNTASTAAGSS